LSGSSRRQAWSWVRPWNVLTIRSRARTPDFAAALAAGGVVLDFSTLEGTQGLLEALEVLPLPAVVAVTGLGTGLRERWTALSQRAPVILASNLSIGAAVVRLLCASAARALPDFDLEVAEIHHIAKADAPSGTALDIVAALAEARGLEPAGSVVHGRRPGDGGRRQGSIGVHAIRGGTVTGEHEILFLGRNERVTIRHSAESREIFATGALRAAAWLEARRAGLYRIDDVVAGALGP
jgi:4-hydroxy-tetrahydrodipicolinate reductase